MANHTLWESVPTPCYLVDETAVEKNLQILQHVQEQTGCKILLALKGFAMFSLAPLVRKYLCGTTASSPDEARLGHEEFGGEVHVCAPGYSDSDMATLVQYCDHIVFNSFSQWQRFKPLVQKQKTPITCALRINPESPGGAPVELYDPCGRCSRLGITIEQFQEEELDGITALHFHALCEQGVDALKPVLQAAEKKFGKYFSKMEYVNFGGGHWITKPDYDVDGLCELINAFKKKYGTQVYLEPGEAIAIHTGYLVSTVLDIIHNDMDIAILDTSAAAHMPDVLEMPYRPDVLNAGQPGELAHTYRLGGPTCLAGDIIGDYSFAEKLEVGSKIVFLDMAHYTMVKNNTFNGVRLPSIAIFNSQTGQTRVVREFGYEDYRNRLS